MLVDQWIIMYKRLNSYLLLRGMFLKILTTFTFIIVYMKMFGRKMIEDGKKEFSTHEIFRTFNKDYKCIFVGDASMSPYEILVPGAGNEHYNHEAGKTWLERAIKNWPSNVWINPLPEQYWDLSHSNGIIKEIFSIKWYH